LRLNTANCAEDGNRTIQDTQGTFYLNGKINMTGRIDDVDPVIVLFEIPEYRGSCRRNGDSPLLFLDHPIHGCGTIVHFTNAIIDTGIVQNALRRCGFTRVDVRHNAYVSDMS
jgi:hypothetical protein